MCIYVCITSKIKEKGYQLESDGGGRDWMEEKEKEKEKKMKTWNKFL